MIISFAIFVVISATGNAKIFSEEGFGTSSYINSSADPCEDFYEYACGNFDEVHPLQNGTLTIDQFSLLTDELTLLLNGILKADETSRDPKAVKKAKLAYRSCTNVEYVAYMKDPELQIVREENGFPLVQPFDLQSQTSFGWNDIGDAVSRYGIPMIFNVYTLQDPLDASKNVIYISQDSLPNPSFIRPYNELSLDDIIEKGFVESGKKNYSRMTSKPAPFDVFLREMAFKIGDAEMYELPPDEIEKNIEDMATFMRGIYKGGEIPKNFTVEMPTSSTSNYTITLKELNDWTRRYFGSSVIDWVEYLGRLYNKANVKITEETEVLNYSGLNETLYGQLNWVKNNKPDTVKSFVMMRVFLFLAIDSDAKSRSLLGNYYSGLGIEILPRWKYCTRKVMDSVGYAGLSFALAYEYQLRHYDTNRFSSVVNMLKNLKNAFSKSLLESAWMDDDDKTAAVEKLNNMVTILGFPDFVSDPRKLNRFYKNLRILRWDNYGNSQRIRAFKQAYQLSQIVRRDRAFWDKSPFEVNAYYNRPNNKITFPVAMLNPPFYGSEDSILDYGKIGSIIAHEITHGFDTKGRLYDKDGSLITGQDKTDFDNYTNCFVDQYNKYYISEIGQYVDGKATLDENLADYGGVKTSYKAMRSIFERTARTGDDFGYTPQQQFFIGYGTVWCNNPSSTYLLKMQGDAHAPSRWRVNGALSNMEAFAEAFSCPSGSSMNPVQKCKLW